MNTNPQFHFYTCPQFAARVGCSPRYARIWLRRWAKTRPGEHVRLSDEQLEAALEDWHKPYTTRDFVARVGCSWGTANAYLRSYSRTPFRRRVRLAREEFEAAIAAWEVKPGWQRLKHHRKSH